ncbi:hypothetical protein PR048_016396 [Dryococelus australis]|uniref:Uncharacterized protein n=1 Tax=Dryococelus australis TaxID=614101 RepID=A0ABQ9HJL6_9NEOP|nr:hypothetical protein PR048_016396 [Dryococelus australis]
MPNLETKINCGLLCCMKNFHGTFVTIKFFGRNKPAILMTAIFVLPMQYASAERTVAGEHILTYLRQDDIFHTLMEYPFHPSVTDQSCKGMNFVRIVIANLQPGMKITFYRRREKDLLPFIRKVTDLVRCSEFGSLLKKICPSKYIPNDNSKRSLTFISLHSGNRYGLIKVFHSTSIKEEYTTISSVLEKLQYQVHQFFICVDLRWHMRQHSQIRLLVKKRLTFEKKNMVHGEKNVISTTFFALGRIILPPLRIKLGLMKLSVKALNRNCSGFEYISKQLPGFSAGKLK